MDALTITTAQPVPLRRETKGGDARPAAAAGSRYDVGILGAPNEIAAIAEEWRALEDRCSGAVLFQTEAWCAQVMRNAGSGSKALMPRIVTVRAQGVLVGLWPLRLTRRLGVRILTDLTDPFGQYADALVEDAADREAVCLAMLEAIRNHGEADGLMLRKVRADAALAPLLERSGRRTSSGDGAPFVRLCEHATYEAYHASLGAKHRKNLRNSRNRLARAGEVVHEIVTDPARRQAAIERAIAMRLDLLDDQASTSRAFNDPAFCRLMMSLAGDGTGRLDPMVMVLSLEGEALAVQWGFVRRDRYYAYVAARGTRHEDASPGRLHLAEVLAACKARGIAIADLLAPAAGYKLNWTSDVMPIADWSVPLSWRGRLALDLWDARLRPVARGVLLRMPRTIRRPIVRMMRYSG